MDEKQEVKKGEVLISWDMIEQRKQYPRDKIILIALIGGAMVILSIIYQSYIFALLISIATAFFIYTGKQKPRTLSFKITDEYLKLDKDTLPIENVTTYNIIEQPGECDFLILETKKIITANEVIPIYDVTREKIEQTMEKIHIQKDATKTLNLLDKLNLIL